MTSQVFYRKWRPRRLSELAGQETVSHTLKQAFVRQRIAHAYLFCGPRGTGKTSTARILAKAVSCLDPQDGEPCNECRICEAVNEGRAMDLIEIDAASNRGIDEIRSIRERVNYAPVEAKYKVYILDEAHMLTDAAADALLKTLEEPPEHVIFVLATTEPHRLPSTIVSRCQRFDFRRIAPTAMADRLARICKAEKIKAEPAALHAITRNATGSMRDAENLLEQAFTSFGSPLGLEQVNLLLGLTADERVRTLVVHVIQGHVPEALGLLSAIGNEGKDLRQLHRQMVDEAREMLLIKSGASEMVPRSPEVVEEQSAVAAQVSMERLFRTLRLLGQVNFRHDTTMALPLELAIVESAREAPVQEAATVETTGPLEERVPVHAKEEPIPKVRLAPPAEERVTTIATPSSQRPAEQTPQPVASEEGSIPPTDEPPISEAEPSPAPVGQPQSSMGDDAELGSRLTQEWDGIVKKLSRHKGRRFNLGALLRACRQPRLEGNTLELPFTHRSHMERMKEELDNPESRRTFLEAVTSALGISEPPSLSFSAPDGQENRTKTLQSPLLQAALGMGGRIVEETEEPNE